MEWVLAAVAVVILGAAAIVGTGRWGSMPPAVDDRYPGFVPDGWLDGDDVRDVRFAVVPRGYSMTQVDALLARLATQLDHGRSLDAGGAGAGDQSQATGASPAVATSTETSGGGGATAHVPRDAASDSAVTTANMPDGIFRLPPDTAL